ncbi:MAG: septal ring lytic transglycosylase RlpA family protein [Candidatus Acidiferrales bacterium]
MVKSRNFPRVIRFSFLLAGLAIALVVAGCARRRPMTNVPASTPAPQTQMPAVPSPPSGPPPNVENAPAVPEQYTEQGIASWYGAQFNGRRTSDGEIYNMFQYTAAHRTLPFGAVVQVTNLNNGKQVDVRINDRGPFVANRIIDLSYAAAVAIGMIGTGTAPVRLDVVAGPNPNAGFFGVQVGAFQSEQSAEQLREQLSGRYSPVTIAPLNSPNGVYYRVRVGRLPSEAAAQQLAGELHAEGQAVAIVVRLDN